MAKIEKKNTVDLHVNQFLPKTPTHTHTHTQTHTKID